jgi:hypothetical protein
MGVGRTDQAFRSEPGIYGFSEIAVFDNAHGFTWEIGKSLPLARILNAAFVHPEYAAGVTLLEDFLDIDVCIQSEL